jgi:hypothetical protein
MTPVPRYEKARRETGGPFRRADLAAGSPGEGTDTDGICDPNIH